MTDLLSEVRAEVEARHRLPPAKVCRAIRESAELSQARLADLLGVHPYTIFRWESGQRRPHGAQLVRYAQVLHELEELVQGR